MRFNYDNVDDVYADHAVWLEVECKVCGETMTTHELPFPLLHKKTGNPASKTQEQTLTDEIDDVVALACDECDEEAEYTRHDFAPRTDLERDW